MDALRWLASQIMDESEEEDEEEDPRESAAAPPVPAQSVPPAVHAVPAQEPADSKRLHRLQEALAGSLVDKRSLADVTWLGVTDGRKRCEAWQLLLGYRPLSRERRGAALRKKRREYRQLRREVLDASRSPAASGGPSWAPLCEGGEASALGQIRRDLPRMVLCGSAAEGAIAALQALVHDPRVRALMERVLLASSVRQPAAGYVQGHHDVLLPLLLVFLADRAGVGLLDGQLSTSALDGMSAEDLEDVEADCFWCLTKILCEVADYYTEGQPGLQRAAVLLRSLLATADRELLESLESEGVEISLLVVRWLGCLMVRELPLPLCVRLWDTCVAELVMFSGGGFGSFLVYFCATFLAAHAGRLRGAPFDELMAFVQQPPTETLSERDLEALISRAYVLRSASKNSSQAPRGGGSLATTSASPGSTPRGSSPPTSEAGEPEAGFLVV